MLALRLESTFKGSMERTGHLPLYNVESSEDCQDLPDTCHRISAHAESSLSDPSAESQYTRHEGPQSIAQIRSGETGSEYLLPDHVTAHCGPQKLYSRLAKPWNGWNDTKSSQYFV